MTPEYLAKEIIGTSTLILDPRGTGDADDKDWCELAG